MEQLERGENAKRHKPFHKIEVKVAWLMLAVHVIQLVAELRPVTKASQASQSCEV